MGRRKHDTRRHAIYFDESIRAQHGFILGAYVLCGPDELAAVARALRTAGLKPGVDEFKWRLPMHGNPHLQELRASLVDILSHTRLGFLVVNADERTDLGEHALRGLVKIVTSNDLPWNLRVFFDQGVFRSRPQAERLADDVAGTRGLELLFERDSSWHLGLQLADAAAGAASEMLLEHLRGVKKQVDVGDEDGGYPPGTMADLGWTFWATFRYAFFTRAMGQDEVRELVPEWAGADHPPFKNMEAVGIYESPNLAATVRDAVRSRFRTVYMGCIH